MDTKWKLRRGSATDQRVWYNNQEDLYYLADHSGDNHSGEGDPDSTEDGPLRINVNKFKRDFVLKPSVFRNGSVVGSVPVFVDRPNAEERSSSVLINYSLAKWLTALYGVPLRLKMESDLWRRDLDRKETQF